MDSQGRKEKEIRIFSVTYFFVLFFHVHLEGICGARSRLHSGGEMAAVKTHICHSNRDIKQKFCALRVYFWNCKFLIQI